MANRKEFRHMFKRKKRQLEENIVLLQKDMTLLKKTELRLIREREGAKRDIEERVRDVKSTLDIYVDKLVESLDTEFRRSMDFVQTKEQEMENKLSSYRNDVEKCSSACAKVKTTGIVSENKVKQMMYDSIDTSRYALNMEEIKCKQLKAGTRTIDSTIAEDIIGTLEDAADLSQNLDALESVGSVECPPFEITSIAHDSESGNWCVCFGAGHDILYFSKDGVHLKTLTIAFKVDDMIVSPNNGVVFCTLPDGHDIRCISMETDRDIRTSVLVKCSLYLHGITWSTDRSTFAVCATDTPNYSDVKPTAVSVIEYSLKGAERKRFQVVGQEGKVYRIAQNSDKSYVLTFPKDGCLVCVDDSGSELASLHEGSDDHGLSGAPFFPSGVCCNSRGHIFVTDWIGKRVWILDRFCEILKSIDENYACPNAICIDRNDFRSVWIGDKGRIRIWKS